MDLYNDSQVPAPSTSAWQVDLGGDGGPGFVVLRTGSTDARAAVINHLLEIGFGPDRTKIKSIVAKATVSEVAVIW